MSYDSNSEAAIPTNIDTSELDAAGLVPIEGQENGEFSQETTGGLEFAVDPDYEAATIASVREASTSPNDFEARAEEENIRAELVEPKDLGALASEKLASTRVQFGELREELAPLAEEHKQLLAEKRALLDKPRPRSPEDTAQLEQMNTRIAELPSLRKVISDKMRGLNDEYDQWFDENSAEYQVPDAIGGDTESGPETGAESSNEKTQALLALIEESRARLEQFEAESSALRAKSDALHSQFDQLTAESKGLYPSRDSVVRQEHINVDLNELLRLMSEVESNQKSSLSAFNKWQSDWKRRRETLASGD